jgi:3-isopropylmalate/(R)-2-methylmalate dehydratase large subunit
MTLCNMAIEAGGTCGVCMPDQVTVDYLWPFIAKDYANDKAKALADFQKWHSDADAQYDSVLTIEANKLVPVATVGYKPDQVKTLAELAKEHLKVDQVYIGSCTNGRLSDLHQAAAVLKGKKLAEHVRGVVSPATPKIFDEAMKDGTLTIFREAGFCVTNPTCGACLGMSNGVLAPGEVCASTTNRNFQGRMGKGGMIHLMSPASAAAAAIAGELVDPRG